MATSASEILAAVELIQRSQNANIRAVVVALLVPRLKVLTRLQLAGGGDIAQAVELATIKIARRYDCPAKIASFISLDVLVGMLLENQAARGLVQRALHRHDIHTVSDKHVIPLCMAAAKMAISAPLCLRQRAGKIFLAAIGGELATLRKTTAPYQSCKRGTVSNKFPASDRDSMFDLAQLADLPFEVAAGTDTNKLLCAAGVYWTSYNGGPIFGGVSPWDITYVAFVTLRNALLGRPRSVGVSGKSLNRVIPVTESFGGGVAPTGSKSASAPLYMYYYGMTPGSGIYVSAERMVTFCNMSNQPRDPNMLAGELRMPGKHRASTNFSG